MPWDFIVILVILGILVPWRGAGRVRALLASSALGMKERMGVYGSTLVVQWVAAGVVAWRWFARGGDLAQVGLLLPSATDTLIAAVGMIAVLGPVQYVGLRRLARLPQDRQGMMGAMARKLMPQTGVERLAFVGLVVTVAVCEEFVYRGFVLEVLTDAAGGVVLAGVFGSSLLFGVAHLYQGVRGVRATFFVGLLFAAARLWTGSLVASIAAHLVTDLIGGLAAPGMLAARTAPSPPTSSALGT